MPSDSASRVIYRFIKEGPGAAESLPGLIISGVLWWRIWFLMGLMVASWAVLAFTVGLGEQGMAGWFVGYVFSILSGRASTGTNRGDGS